MDQATIKNIVKTFLFFPFFYLDMEVTFFLNTLKLYIFLISTNQMTIANVQGIIAHFTAALFHEENYAHLK